MLYITYDFCTIKLRDKHCKMKKCKDILNSLNIPPIPPHWYFNPFCKCYMFALSYIINCIKQKKKKELKDLNHCVQ